jgi:glycosyltransferase involved in cell wall biosynthesis
LDSHKGGTFLIDCVEAAQNDGANINWHVIGEFSPSLRTRVQKVGDALHVTGRYGSYDLPRLLADIAPHVIFFPQRWPETYSYTLSEAFEAACIIVAPDIGAFTERVAGISWCWLYPVDIAPKDLVGTLTNIRFKHIAVSDPPEVASERPYGMIPVNLGFYRQGYLSGRVTPGSIADRFLA